MLIDKNLGTPYYIQISDHIQKEIADGVYSNGEIMPSELEMQKKFDVSRVTVRKAYKLLIDNGLLKSIKGKGTFVNILEKGDWISMKSFTKDVIERGHIPSTKIIDFEKIKVPPHIAANLQVEKGTSCYYLNRLRCIDKKAVWLTKTYILADAASGLTKEHFAEQGMAQSIFTVLNLNYGLQFRAGPSMSIENNISEKDAKLLKIDVDKPVICKASIVTDENGRVIVYENTIFEQSISYSPDTENLR